MSNYAVGAIIDLKFTTVGADGAPTALAGTPAISVYKDNGATESTTGVTLTVDFDARTGLNHVRVTTASDGTFYSADSSFQVVITTGTVGGTSVVGYVVGSFDLVKEVANVTHVNGSPINNLVSGRVDASAGAIAANAITATAIADDAITAAKIAAGALTAAKFAAGAFDAVWSAAARTLTGFGTLAADVWSSVSRTLTAGTNIALAKGTGVTGFNDLDAAAAQAAAAAALAAYDPPTNAELEARTLPAANYFDPVADEVAADVVKWMGEAPDALSTGAVRADVWFWRSAVPSFLNAGLVRSDLSAVADSSTGVADLSILLQKSTHAAANFSASAVTSTTVTINPADYTASSGAPLSAIDDFYAGAMLFVHEATGVIYPRRVIAYDGTTRRLTVDRPFDTLPDAIGDWFYLFPAAEALVSNVAEIQAGLAADADLQTALTRLTDVYQARIRFTDDEANGLDRWGAIWHKNGAEVPATGTKITVIRTGDDVVLVNEAAMVAVGSEPATVYDEAVNRTVGGVRYLVKLTATIDGETRTYHEFLARDSA